MTTEKSSTELTRDERIAKGEADVKAGRFPEFDILGNRTNPDEMYAGIADGSFRPDGF